jgi:hypothetical protein
LNVHRVSDVRQTEIHIAEPIVPDPIPFEMEIAIVKLKKNKPPVSDEIPAELIQAGGEILRSEVHTLINSIRNKEELPNQWKESIILQIHRKGDKPHCSHYRGISLLSTSYKIVSSILLSSLSPYADKIFGDRPCGFRRNRSVTDQIVCVCQILQKNGSTMRQY